MTPQLGLSDNEQVPRSPRRTALPVARIDGALLMRHEHLAGALVEWRELGKTSSGAHSSRHHPPEAFDGVAVRATVRREAREAQRALVVVACRITLLRPMHPTAIADHDDLCAGCAKDCHHLLERLTQLLGIKGRHNCIADFGGAILDGANDAEQPAPGETAPGASACPRLAFEGCRLVALARAQRTGPQAIALGPAPPAVPGERKAPEDRCVCVESKELALASPGLEGGEWERSLGEGRGMGIETPGRSTRASRVFFQRPRTLSRPSWTPVSRAQTVASA
jgi:hypothetical protein